MKISELLVSFAISTPQTMFDQKTAEKWMDAMGVEDEEIKFSIANDLRNEVEEMKNRNFAMQWFCTGMENAFAKDIKPFETLYTSLNSKSDTL